MELSVVIPVYNERENVEPLLQELVPVLRGTGTSFEVLLVDDGSDDGTTEEIRSVATGCPELRPLRLRRNTGQTAAFEAGFRASKGRFVLTMDGDRQNDPADIPAFLELRERYDLVYGWRRNRRDPLLKRVSTRVANFVRNRLTGEDVHDTGCSLKLFRGDMARSLKLFNGLHRFFPTLVRMNGGTRVEIPVNHRPRVAGRSKYGMWNRVFRALRDLLAVRWMMKRNLRYEADEISRGGGG